MIAKGYPNMLSYWAHALDGSLDLGELTECLIVTVKVHECRRVDHTLGLSGPMLDLCCDILKHCGDEVGIMHERQSGGLMDWLPSIYERRLFSFCISANDELESLLGGVDDRVRRFSQERTIITGAHAVGNRNKTTPWILEKEATERSLYIRAAMAASPGQAKFDKDRQAKVAVHHIEKAATAAKEQADKIKLILKAAKKHEATTVALSEVALAALSLSGLRLQVQYWQHQARHVWQGLATERWRVLLGRSKQAFRMGDAVPQKDKEAHELEKQRYISLLTAVVFHRTQPMSDAMRVELTKECAPRPKVTPK